MIYFRIARAWPFRAALALLLLSSVGWLRADGRMPDCYILSAGVDNYPNVNKLSGCLNDAKNTVSAFQAQKGNLFGKVTTETLLDSAATHNAILQKFQAFSRQGVAGDVMVLFVSGHGARTDSNKTWYYLPYDYSSSTQATTALTDRQILDAADTLVKQDKRVVIIIDACFCGQLRITAQPYFDRYKSGKGGLVLLLSSAADQLSYALGDYSAFAKAISDGMSGTNSDANRDGMSTIQEIGTYSYKRTYDLLKAKGNKSKQDSMVAWSPSVSSTMPLAATKRVVPPADWHTPFPITASNITRSGSDLTAVSRNPDQVDVFWIAPNGAIATNWWTGKANGARWNNPFNLTPAGTARGDSPVVSLSRIRDHIDVFWIGPDGSVRSAWWSTSTNKWAAPFNIAPPGSARAGSDLAAASRHQDHVDVFWVAPNGSINSAWWGKGANNGAWAKPFPISPPNAARADSKLSATGRTTDQVHVFWTSVDGGVTSTFWTKQINKWVAPFSVTPRGTVGAGSSLSAMARRPDHMEVVWVAPDGAVNHTWANSGQDNGQWHKPFPLTKAHAVRPSTPLTMHSRKSEHIDVFWINTDGSIGSSWWSSKVNGGRWNTPYVVSAPGAARGDAMMASMSRVAEHIDVFWIAPDGCVRSNWWGD